MLIAFFGALRIGELVAVVKSDMSLSSVQRKGMAVSEGQVIIHLRR